MRDLYNIAIVGAGPAGAYLALKLAEMGKECIIIDGSHPREKPCGGGLSSITLKKFPFLIEIKDQGFESKGLLLRSPEGKELFMNEHYQLNISRKILDQFILSKAIEKKTIHVSENVIRIEEENEIWKLFTKSRIIKAKTIVGADGALSLVRRKIIGSFKRNELMPFCVNYLAGEKYEYNLIQFLLNYKGYFWGFQQKDQISVGMGDADYIYGKYNSKVFNDLIKKYYVNSKIIGSYGCVSPNSKGNPSFHDRQCSSRNWILIGDAAGHVDAYTSEGILYALWGAELASEALIKEKPQMFDSFWRKAYLNKLLERTFYFNKYYNSKFIEKSIRIASKNKLIKKTIYNILMDGNKRNIIVKFIKYFIKIYLRV